MHVSDVRGNILTDVQAIDDTQPMPATVRPQALADYRDHEIISILERPVLVGEFDWKTSDGQVQKFYDSDIGIGDGIMYSADFPSAIATVSALVREKLQNFLYLKTDLEVELKVNATPFQQGALLLVYNPYFSQMAPVRVLPSFSLAGLTSYPSRILDLQEGNSIRMTIPYVNEYDYFNLSNLADPFGEFQIFSLVPLRGEVAEETVSVTVLARFTNITLKTPTNKGLSTTLDKRTLQQRVDHFLTDLQDVGFDKADVSDYLTQGETEEVNSRGIVSGIANTISNVSGAFSKIPGVGALASAVSTASGVVGSVAQALGFSKVSNIMADQPVQRVPGYRFTHTQGIDSGVTLAQLQENAINPGPAIPETEDEMSIDYIKKRPGVIHRVSVPITSLKAGDEVLRFEVQPTPTSVVVNEGIFAAGTAFGTVQGTCLSFLTALAAYWRGTLNYELRCVKTRYHSGRLLIRFFPDYFGEGTPSNDLNLCYSMICDLNPVNGIDSGSTWRFSIPFVNNIPWKRTLNPVFLDGVAPEFKYIDQGTARTATGTVIVTVLTSFVAPPTVSQNLDFLVSMHGGDDFELAYPTIQGYPGPAGDIPAPPMPMTQGPGALDDTMPYTPLFEGSTEDVVRQTVGESFLSLRAFIKRFANSNRTTGLIHEMEPVSEVASGIKLNGGSVVGSTRSTVTITPVELCSWLYRFKAGGYRYKVFSKDDLTVVSSPRMIKSSEAYGETAYEGSYTYYPDHALPQHTNIGAVHPVLEFTVPYYNDRRMRTIGKVYNEFSTANVAEVKPARDNLYVAGADDLSYFFLVGPPFFSPFFYHYTSI